VVLSSGVQVFALSVLVVGGGGDAVPVLGCWPGCWWMEVTAGMTVHSLFGGCRVVPKVVDMVISF
jgi:hypothetical protein